MVYCKIIILYHVPELCLTGYRTDMICIVCGTACFYGFNYYGKTGRFIVMLPEEIKRRHNGFYENSAICFRQDKKRKQYGYVQRAAFFKNSAVYASYNIQRHTAAAL